MNLRRDKFDYYYGDVARNYLRERQAGEKWRNEQAIMQRVISDMRPGNTVLDAPLGTGRFVRYYLKQRLSVIGIDISEDMISEAAKECARDFEEVMAIRADIRHIPLADSSVDDVICFRFLGFLNECDFEQVVTEFVRVSRERIILEMLVIDSSKIAMVRKIVRGLWAGKLRFIRGMPRGIRKSRNRRNEKDLIKYFESRNLHVVKTIENGRLEFLDAIAPLKVFILRNPKCRLGE